MATLAQQKHQRGRRTASAVDEAGHTRFLLRAGPKKGARATRGYGPSTIRHSPMLLTLRQLVTSATIDSRHANGRLAYDNRARLPKRGVYVPARQRGGA